MDLMQKMTILTEGAKYDAACTSSGSERSGKGGTGNTLLAGCCHSFSADGRCISLLKILMTNHCIYDCKYCVNRSSNDVKRAVLEPYEMAELTIQFYRRNYIEGLFLSSGVLRSPDHTMELMIKTIRLLREEYHFWGYIHAKSIPGASPALITRLGMLVDRISVNIELPSERSLKLLAPHKTKQSILTPMAQIAQELTSNGKEIVRYKSAPKFAPAGQATQMIIGASPESDYQILRLATGLYQKYKLKRVFYSAYVPAVQDSLLPAIDTKPPLLREHRFYQADWLLRYYNFTADELLTDKTPNFNPYLDPKSNWAVNNLHLFPVDVNWASLNDLLRVPGIGPTGARHILTARKTGKLGLQDLKRMGIILKRAQFFITAADYTRPFRLNRENTVRALIDPKVFSFGTEQLSFFGPNGAVSLPGAQDVRSVKEAVEEAVLCLATNI
jgi:putative DNA modification/repair radical SAM protein